MALACVCSNGFGNTGTPNCSPLFTVAKKLILVQTFDSSGALNKLDSSSVLSQAALDLLINETDASKRWYPLPLIENVAGERAESQFEEAGSGRKSFIKQGTRSMSFEIFEQGPVLEKQLEGIRCGKVSVFIIDAEGSIRGMELETPDGFLYPIKIDKNSWDVNLNQATDSTGEKLVISFDYDQTEQDALLRMITSNNIDADLLDSAGLLDILATYTLPVVGSVTVNLKTLFGSMGNEIADTGLVAADFFDVVGGTASNAFNVTDTAAEPIASVVETPIGSGQYLVTYTAPVTVSDIIRFTIVKDGRDYTAVATNPVTTL